MKKYKNITKAIILATILTSCESIDPQVSSDVQDNPLLQESTLAYHAPDFSKIKDEHYRPAFRKAIALQSQKVKEITENHETPTFENTILALEKSGVELERISQIFYALSNANTNDSIQSLQRDLAPLLSQHQDSIHLNTALFGRIKTLYQDREKLALTDEERKLLKFYYDNFVISGAKLSEGEKQELKKINAELATLQTQFNQELLQANNAGALVVKDSSQLKGLSPEQMKAYKEGTQWKIPLQNTTQQPLLTLLENREIRRKLYENSWNRASSGKNDTRSVILQIVKL